MKTAPPPGLSAASILPPWASTICLQMDRPSPVPVSLRETNGSKIRGPRSAGKPQPESTTRTVSQRSNALYWALIKAFDALTGVPMLLNTSFNENEPIVLRPEEALDCFLRTRMDVLVLGNTFIHR